MAKMKSWGEEIWESKIKNQNEERVIFGTHSDIFGGG